MKNRDRRDEHKIEKAKSSKSMEMKRKKKNMKRLGGGGLSLEAFANVKSMNNQYNPSLIRKQREFYKNAKYVSKFKKSLKQQSQEKDLSSTQRPSKDENKTEEVREVDYGRDKQNKKKKSSLEELYRKKCEEEEKSRMERKAMIQAKKDEREKAEARRKASKGKMMKKTQFGQPVMKYRIEHLLESIQSSNGNASNKNTSPRRIG